MPHRQRDRVKTGLVVVIGVVCLVWGFVIDTRSRDAQQRLNGRSEFMSSVKEAFQETTHDRITRDSVIRLVRDLAEQNSLVIPVDDEGNELWPPKMQFVLPFIPDEVQQ